MPNSIYFQFYTFHQNQVICNEMESFVLFWFKMRAIAMWCDIQADQPCQSIKLLLGTRCILSLPKKVTLINLKGPISWCVKHNNENMAHESDRDNNDSDYSWSIFMFWLHSVTNLFIIHLVAIDSTLSGSDSYRNVIFFFLCNFWTIFIWSIFEWGCSSG